MEYFPKFRNESPRHFQNILQFLTYKTLNEFQIDYEWAEDRPFAQEQPGRQMPQVLLLKSDPPEKFFLFLTDKEKDFPAEDFCDTLEIPKVHSVSSEETMRILGTPPETSTAFSVFLDSAEGILVVVDRIIAEAEELVLGDGSDGGLLKIRTADLLDRLLPQTGHSVVVIG
jgi:Ala-tRNA(Pro) deacylase